MFELPIAKWIETKDMSSQEKKNWPGHKELGGFLRRLSYKDAWAVAWPNASQEFKDWVKNLPHFNADIFESITGLKWAESTSLKGKEVEVKLDGQVYKAIIQ